MVGRNKQVYKTGFESVSHPATDLWKVVSTNHSRPLNVLAYAGKYQARSHEDRTTERTDQ
jgi:hypothetical protein